MLAFRYEPRALPSVRLPRLSARGNRPCARVTPRYQSEHVLIPMLACYPITTVAMPVKEAPAVAMGKRSLPQAGAGIGKLIKTPDTTLNSEVIRIAPSKHRRLDLLLGKASTCVRDNVGELRASRSIAKTSARHVVDQAECLGREAVKQPTGVGNAHGCKPHAKRIYCSTIR